MQAHAVIKKSRSKKKPFSVSVIGENGEPLMSAQLFTTKLNCKKNLRAVMKCFSGSNVLVVDKTGKEELKYDLWYDGFEEIVSYVRV